MTTSFKREPRYFVFKISDVRKHLSRDKFELVGSIAEKLNAGRAVEGKVPLDAVVVESDWPEYEQVWQMIEARAKMYSIAEAEKQEPLARERAIVDSIVAEHGYPKEFKEFEAALKAAQPAQPKQEQGEPDDLTIAYMSGYYDGKKSQQRKPLTREVIDRDFYGRVDFVRQVEAAHDIKE